MGSGKAPGAFKLGFCRRSRSLPGTQGRKCFPHIHLLILSPTPIFFLPSICSLPPVLFSSSPSSPFLCSSSCSDFFSSPPFLHPTPSPLVLPSFLPLPLLPVMSLGWAQPQMKHLSPAQPRPQPQTHLLRTPCSLIGDGRPSWNRWAL